MLLSIFLPPFFLWNGLTTTAQLRYTPLPRNAKPVMFKSLKWGVNEEEI